MPLPPHNLPCFPENGSFRAPDRKSATVLIVEDNDVVADFLQCVFRAYGYQTLLAATPDEAIAHCEREPNAIHALIADVRLGRFDGFKTARSLQAICPQMKVILTSGYPQDHLVRSGLLPEDLGAAKFVQKPFLPQEILAALKLPRLTS